MNHSWSQAGADTYTPDGSEIDSAWSRTTHLAIGAHQDDLEIMAIEGILKAIDQKDAFFSGVVATDGRGSARAGQFAHVSNERMRTLRREEQREAADKGQYNMLLQLDHPSHNVRDSSRRELFVGDLLRLFQGCRPQVVYTHSLFDGHATHLGVMLGVIEAIRRLAPGDRPQQVIGCEVWGDLDWLPLTHKIIMNVSAHTSLQEQLLSCFRSQIAGGKRYDLAALGRRRAHATFGESHQVDQFEGVVYGMDLGPLIEAEVLNPAEYVSFLCSSFQEQTLSRLQRVQ